MLILKLNKLTDRVTQSLSTTQSALSFIVLGKISSNFKQWRFVRDEGYVMEPISDQRSLGPAKFTNFSKSYKQ